MLWGSLCRGAGPGRRLPAPGLAGRGLAGVLQEVVEKVVVAEEGPLRLGGLCRGWHWRWHCP